MRRYATISQHIFTEWAIGTKRTSSHCRNIGQYHRISGDIAVYTAILPYIRRYCRIYGDIARYFYRMSYMNKEDVFTLHKICWDIVRYREISWDIVRYFMQCEDVLFVPIAHSVKISCDIAVYFFKECAVHSFRQYAAILPHIFVVWTFNKICGDIAAYWRISANIAGYAAILLNMRRYCSISTNIGGYIGACLNVVL